MAKKTNKKRGVKTIEPSAVPDPAMHKQSKKKGGRKKITAKKTC